MKRPGIAALLFLCACTSRADPNEQVWTMPLAHPALQDGVTLRSHEYRWILPAMGETYVVRKDRSLVRTFAELQAVLAPIDSVDTVMHYRRMLRWIALEDRDEALKALDASLPLDFHEGDEAFYEVYVASDAKRWNVPHEPVIETTAETIVITQPQFRRIWRHDGTAWAPALGVVELVRETFHRDGRYEREVLRELERGKSAMKHEPAPLI